jgi:cyclopropane fatty-acyl-phospholipid synthase-like methyltransferase
METVIHSINLIILIGLSPEETFVPPKEYRDYLRKINGLRKRIASVLPLEARMRVIDIVTGSAYFAVELAAVNPTLKIVGIDGSERLIRVAERNVREKWLDSDISILKMDSRRLEFQASSFGLATSFQSLEEIHMNKGTQELRETFHEVARVLKPRGYFCFIVMPPEEAETPAQRLECEVSSYLCGITLLPAIKYQEFLRGAGFTLVKRETFYTGYKLTAEEAKDEIAIAGEQISKIYGIKTKSFDEVWKRFGQEIEVNGLGHNSRVVLMIARKNT